jgi:cell shape-determining protein MreD
MIIKILFSNFSFIVLSIITLLFSLMPLNIFGTIFIPWFIPVIFIWECNNDYKFNPLFIAFIALIFDFLTGNLLGLNSLILVVLGKIIYSNRYILRGQTFVIQWISFSICLLILFIVEYLLSSIAKVNFIDVVPFIFNLIIIAVTYPVFYKIFDWIDKYEGV